MSAPTNQSDKHRAADVLPACDTAKGSWRSRVSSLRVKVLLAFVVVALVPLAILALFNYFATRQALTHSANQALFAAASQTAAQMDAVIAADLAVIGSEAKLPGLVLCLRSLPGRCEQAPVLDILRSFSQRNAVFISSYALLDLQGRNLVDTDVSGVGSDESAREYFQAALETGLPYVSSVEFSAGDGMAYLYFSSAVADAVTGKPLGVLRARYGAAFLQQLVVQGNGLVGAGPYPVMLDENGLILADGFSSPGSPFSILYKAASSVGLADSLVLVDSPAPYFFVQRSGSDVADAAAVTRMNTRPWLVAFLEPQEMLLAPARAQARDSAVLAAIIVLIVAIVAIGAARLLTDPIMRLTSVARHVAGGKLDARADIESNDEIGILAQAFNSMTSQLNASIVSLEQRLGELERTSRALRESEARLDNIVANSPGIIYRCANDEHWTMEFISAGITRITGYAAEDFLNNRVRAYVSIIHPDDRQRVVAAVASGLARNEHYEMDYRLVAADGSPRWVHEQGRGVFAPDGQFLYLDGVIFDITVLRKAEDALHLSSERLRLATRVASIGIWDWDIPKNELLWEDSMYQLYGIQKGDFGGAYDAWIRTVHPEDKAHTDGEIQAALRGEREYAPEFRIVRPDGSIRYIKADSQTFKDQDGKPLRMIGTNIDITERKQSEEDLRHYKDQLEETVQRRTAELVLARDAAEAANKAKSVFLANMSHELRTPLNAILGFSSMMKREPQLTDVQRENIDIINRSGAHLLSLINDVLEIAKIEAGRLQLEIAPFDLGAMVRDVAEMMQLRAREKGLQLLLEMSSGVPRHIKGDEARLRQILINLLGNAVKFTEQGGVTIRVGVHKNDRLLLLVEVEDSGPGMSEEDQKRIFRPFVQLADSGEQVGTGLGLTITKQFVELMSGTIAVESTVGKGSLFRFELPVELADTEELPKTAVAAHGEIIGLAPGQPAYRVLIVEDQHENQLLLNWLMSDIGIEARLAENGEQCVKVFEEWHPDLIWMDRRMPVMDGEEATRRVRRLPGGDKVKIVAVTASAFREEQQEMLDAGMDDFVRKPYRPNEIYDSLARQLGVRYIHEDAGEAPTEPVVLTSEMMAVLPETLRVELKTALQSLDSARVAEAIRQVGAYDGKLAKLLNHLADNFDYPAILRLL